MFGRILSITFVLLLAGCDSGGQLAVTSQSQPLAASYPSVRTVIVPTAPGSAKYIPEIQNSLNAHLLGSGQFQQLVVGTQQASVTIRVDITQFDHVSGTERVLLGVLAGRNRIDASVVVTDGATGVPLRQFTTEGVSAAYPFSGETNFHAATRQFVREVVAGLKSG